MTYRFPISAMKNLQQLAVVASASFEVDGVLYNPPPKGLVISESFWRRYGCYLHCGGCCSLFTLDYIPEEFEQFKQLYPQYQERAKEFTLNVNGAARKLIRIEQVASWQRNGRNWCQFLSQEDAACIVHAANPFSCQTELIKFKSIKGKGYIQKAPYGRAHLLKTIADEKILCDFAPLDIQQVVDNDFPVLHAMRRWAEYLGIETHLNKVIFAVEDALLSNSYRRMDIALKN